MAQYGYRLFDVELRQAMGRTAVDFAECADSHYLDHLRRALTALKGRVWVPARDASAIPLEGADVEPGDSLGQVPSLRIEDWVPLGLTTFITLRFGRHASHDIALRHPDYRNDGEAEDVPLAGLAPTRLYRVVIALPPSGKTASMVAETIARGSAWKWLLTALRQEAQRSSTAADGSAVAPWWRLCDPRPVADPAHLAEVLNGEVTKVVLRRDDRTAGRMRNNKELEVTAFSASQRGIKAILGEWYDASRKGKPVSAGDGAAELAKIVGVEVEGGFDSGEVTLDGYDAKPKRITPDISSEIFTYLQGRGDRLDDKRFYSVVSGRLQRIEPENPKLLEWPEW